MASCGEGHPQIESRRNDDPGVRRADRPQVAIKYVHWTGVPRPANITVPDTIFANVGKLLLATQIYDMHRLAHHVSGGLIVALPGLEAQRPPEGCVVPVPESAELAVHRKKD